MQLGNYKAAQESYRRGGEAPGYSDAFWEVRTGYIGKGVRFALPVLLRAALPMEEAGPGFAYAASGYELQEAWRDGLTNRVEAAGLVSGWLPVFGLETIAELGRWCLRAYGK